MTASINDSVSKNCAAGYKRDYLSSVVIADRHRMNADPATCRKGASHAGSTNHRLDDPS